MGEAVLDRPLHGRQRLVGQLLTSRQGSVPGGFVAGDHRRVGVGIIVVEADESQVCEGPESRRPQLGGELVSSSPV
ncbi:hypothetical protein ACFYY3_21295 [Streptomyces sp. NPDC001812]|uniref:hypothetical protein n=1 Tax=unclassified Streptomyces TaxID=2593676 RepID=UPI00367D6195